MLKKLADAFTEVPQLSSLLTQVQEASAIRSVKRDTHSPVVNVSCRLQLPRPRDGAQADGPIPQPRKACSCRRRHHRSVSERSRRCEAARYVVGCGIVQSADPMWCACADALRELDRLSGRPSPGESSPSLDSSRHSL
jgi:hypothetical protein